MDPDDQLFGRVKNRTLTVSGDRPSIRVAGGELVVKDGPIAYTGGPGPAPSVEERMVELRLPRAGCPVDRIVVIGRDGWVSFSALRWMHAVNVGFVHLTYNGELVFASGPAGTDQPSLRRAQAAAAGSQTGVAIMRELLCVKLEGQAAVARNLPDGEATAGQIGRFATAIEVACSVVEMLAAEAAGAALYWRLWSRVPLRFARRDRVPEGWQVFGVRQSPLTGSPFRAATPGSALLNYIYTVVQSEMTIALIGAGLDAGIGVAHTDLDRRPSLTLDAIEALRPCADGWLLNWLSETRFAKSDFFETSDGQVRITRPLSTHLGMTAPLWRDAAIMVAGWIANVLRGESRGSLSRPRFPAPSRYWKGPPIPMTCHECGASAEAA